MWYVTVQGERRPLSPSLSDKRFRYNAVRERGEGDVIAVFISAYCRGCFGRFRMTGLSPRMGWFVPTHLRSGSRCQTGENQG